MNNNRRIIVGFIILIAVFVISEVISFRNLEKSKAISSKNSELIQPSIIQLNELQLLISQSEDYTNSWTFFDISQHEDKIKLIELRDKTLPPLLLEIKKTASNWDSNEDKKRIENAFLLIDSMLYHQTWIIENLNNFDAYDDLVLTVEAEDTHLAMVEEYSKQTIEILHELVDGLKEQSQKEESIAQESFKSIRIVHLVLAIVAILVVLIVAYKTYTTIKLEQQKQIITEERDQIKAQKLIIEEKNDEILSSISYAERLQNSILPSSQEIKEAFGDCFIMFNPRDIVSGDFYWFRRLDQTKRQYVIAAADCTGHGVPGAFVSFVGYSALNRAIDQYNLTEPQDILEKTSEMVATTFFNQNNQEEISDGMDIALCTLDLDNMVLKYSGAHNPLYIVRNGELIKLAASSRSVGANFKALPFEVHTFALEKGDMLYLCSDGFQDQFGGPKGKKFMVNRFKRMLIEHASNGCSIQKDNFSKELNDWMTGYEQIDDILVIGVKI